MKTMIKFDYANPLSGFFHERKNPRTYGVHNDMVKLYREKFSPQADIIEAELQDMTFGYDREILDLAEAAQKFGPDHTLPVITNNEKWVSGAEIPAYMKELQILREDWQAYQGDSCYVNDRGETC
jgi:hypothetical protein